MVKVGLSWDEFKMLKVLAPLENQPPPYGRFSPERRRVLLPFFRWRHGDEASPCRHPGGALPPLPWSERSRTNLRRHLLAIGRKMIGNLGHAVHTLI